MTSKNKQGRKVLQHQATRETATLFDVHSADYDRLTSQSTPNDELRNQWASIVAEFDQNARVFNAYVADIRLRIAFDNGWTGGTDHLRAFVRNGRFITSRGTTFKVTHGHDAVWCREVCRRNPDVAPHILPTLRPSKFDVFYPDLFGGAAHE